MKRDLDYIRELLKEFEEAESWYIVIPHYKGMNPEEKKRLNHVRLLCDSGFMTQISENGYRLTSSGHDFLDATRKSEIWEKTKSSVQVVGGWTLETVKDTATAYVKQELIKLGLPL